jgi:hypothetical protein
VLLQRPFPETEREGEDCGRREMTCGAHMAVREERAGGYRFGAGRCWAVAGFWSWAERLPGVRFHIFLFFTPFLFLFSYLIHRFCKNVPNQFKPLSEILQKSLQGFKSVGKQVFKIKTRFLIEFWIGAKGFACIKLNRILR